VEAILEAAARILERAGYEGFTTNAVAERAGVSIGSLYQYFPNKAALMAGLIRRETAILIEEAEAALMLPSGRQAIELLIEAAVMHQLRRPALARILDFEEGRWPDDEDMRSVAERLRGMLAGLLDRADMPKQPDAGVAAGDVFAMIRGIVDAAGERGETDAVGLKERVGRAVFGYLRSG